VPAHTAVDLGGGVQAFRYENLPIGSGKSATIYAIPTTTGVDALACVPSKGTFAATCDAVASTLRVSDGKALPVGPSQEYAGQLSSALSKLHQQQASAAAQLKKAKTRLAQAQATDRLAAAYTTAGRTLAGLSLGPADEVLNAKLAAGLKATGAAYKQAAGEARRKDANGFKRQSSKAIAAQKDVSDALAGLKAAGYGVKS
jgi:hypothetical protein